MKAHLRMSDVFSDGVYVGTDEWMNGWFEVRHVGGSSIDESCDGGYSERDANYVAHAINSHDELAAEVERLRGLMVRIISSAHELSRKMPTTEFGGGYKQCAMDTANAIESYLNKGA